MLRKSESERKTREKGREVKKTRTNCKERRDRNKERQREKENFGCLRSDPVDISINYH